MGAPDTDQAGAEATDHATEPATTTKGSENSNLSVESNGTQTLVTGDYGTVQILAVVEPQTTPNSVEDAVVDVGNELVLALNGPTPRTAFTTPETHRDTSDPQEEVA